MGTNTIDTEVLNTKRYEVGKPVGRGTWGVVYGGVDTFMDEDVAIKVLDPTNTAMEQMGQRNIDSLKAMKKEGGGLVGSDEVCDCTKSDVKEWLKQVDKKAK